MKEILKFAERLAVEAGRITLKHFGAGIEVETKPDASPVTAADREAEVFIRAEIEKRFPEDGILGEEFGAKEGTSGVRWIIDPIDGTKNFIRHIPLYGTLIAVEVDGQARIGVVNTPPLGETVSALTGHGCFFNGERCHVSRTSRIEDASWVTTSLDYFLDRWGIDAFEQITRRSLLQRTWGDSYGYTLVATGRIDAMLDPIVNPWDIAPMIPIINEAGGLITDTAGNGSHVIGHCIACNASLHEAMLEILRPSVDNRLDKK